MDMEVEGETAAARPHRAVVNTPVVDVDSMDSQAMRYPTSNKSKNLVNECMSICRPPIYDGRRDHEVIERFLDRLGRYLRLFQDSEEEKVLLASCFLDGDAGKWWSSLCEDGRQPPPGIATVQDFREAVAQQFMPKSIRQQAMEGLQKLKQGKMSVDVYTRKFKSLVQRSGVTDPHFLYQWFIAGLNQGARDAVTSWATLQKANNMEVGIGDMIRYLHINEEMSATQISLAGKSYENPDLEPMDVGAVTTRPPLRQGYRNGIKKGKDNTGKPAESSTQARTCFFCGKPNHLIKDCRLMQKARESWKKDSEQRKQAAREAKKKHQGNAKAPTQPAAQ